jgi:uncharacterized damage-inducible protein DinB
MADLMTEFIRQNEWANHTLIDACRDLTDEQLDTHVPGTYGSIRQTWHHIVGAEGGYATQLGNEPAGRLRRDDPLPGWDELKEKASEAAAALTKVIEPADRMIHFDRDDEDVEATVILIQVFQHGTDHRSQICTTLTTLGIEPPEIDSWSWGFANGKLIVNES